MSKPKMTPKQSAYFARARRQNCKIVARSFDPATGTVIARMRDLVTGREFKVEVPA